MIAYSELQAGKYYMPVFERIEPLNEFGNEMDTHRFDAPFYQYIGDGQFLTEDGDPVDSFYDPELGLYVACNGADGFSQ